MLEEQLFAFESEFRENFKDFRDRRMVLYGIGSRTAAIIAHNDGFQIVGLMDKDPANIGKSFFGLPVVSLDTAEHCADMIVISATELFYEVIYRRIRHTTLPVYFFNGKPATLSSETTTSENPYWQQSWEHLRKRASAYDVISFDVFDTLLLRTLLKPTDAFTLLDRTFHREGLLGRALSFEELRAKAAAFLPLGYTLDELYEAIGREAGLDSGTLAHMKELELSLEETLLRPRESVVAFARSLTEQGKEVYAVSDMYLSSAQIAVLLQKAGLPIPQDHVIVSCEVKREKSDGSIWPYVLDRVGQNRRILHIGDNHAADVQTPQRFGIDTAYLMSAPDLLRASSVCGLEEVCLDAVDSLLVGTVAASLMNDPFVLCETKGQVRFSSMEQWGYAVWGWMLHIFYCWAVWLSREKHADSFLFPSRDGYLLEKDYAIFREAQGGHAFPASRYFLSSRIICYISDITDEASLWRCASKVYLGTFADYMWDRFLYDASGSSHAGEQVQLPADLEKIKGWLQGDMEKLWANIAWRREQYQKYIQSLDIQDGNAVVDFGFYGTILNSVSRLAKKRLHAFYFNADLSGPDSAMCACFQEPEDTDCVRSRFRSRNYLVESLFTAPYGSFRCIDGQGNPQFAPEGHNQRHFAARETINAGAVALLRDAARLARFVPLSDFAGKAMTADRMFGILCDRGELSEEIKSIFSYEDQTAFRGDRDMFH